MKQITETLDRIAQSHIEGRVQPVLRDAAPCNYRCASCGAEFEPRHDYWPHLYSCPSFRSIKP